MVYASNSPNGLPADILRLIFDNLVGDSVTLARAGLVSRSWRTLSLPLLLKNVDLSCHNDGEIPQEVYPSLSIPPRVVMGDFSDENRDPSLVPRQRAFLRLMTEQPELTRHVKALTWTLVWIDFDDDALTDIDLRTWEVFARMQKVTRLDLASLHCIHDQPYIRQNPTQLFPAVTDLRLVGWMHRGLVKAIVTSLDAGKLRRLQLDHLQEEGALPSGEPIPQDLALEHLDNPVDPYTHEGINEELWERQERGEAAVFPGPMWLPLRLLRGRALTSMDHLQITLDPFTGRVDLRNNITMFRETAEFIKSAKATLKNISVGLGECPTLHEEFKSTCGTSRIWIRHTYRPMCFDLTSAFLQCLLRALNEEQFPHLTTVDLKGFRIIRNGTSRMAECPDPDVTWQYIRGCHFVEEGFLDTANADERDPFCGYDYHLQNMNHEKLEELKELLGRS